MFTKFANTFAEWAGSHWAFLLAFGAVIVWAFTGPIFHFSDTWQLVINTSTTIITFLMVFLIQHTQNQDSKALHLKLDELIHANDAADNALSDAEHWPTEKLREELEKRSRN